MPGCYASGLPAGEAAELAAAQRPLAAAAVSEPPGPPAWSTIRIWAVIGTSDQVIPPAELPAVAACTGRAQSGPATHPVPLEY